MVAAWIIAPVAAILLAWGAVTFNTFIRLRNRMREAFSGTDVQLRRRHDLIPNLVRTVRDYNNRTEQFPANLLAPLFGMRAGEFFEISSPAERAAPSFEMEPA